MTNNRHFFVCYNNDMSFEHTDTNLSKENEYPKLVRDKIPEIIQASGREAHVRTLELEEYIEFLKIKVTEEAQELASSGTDSNLLEEIVDLRELLDALEKAKGFTREQVKATQDDKRDKRGSFDLRLLMLDNK